MYLLSLLLLLYWATPPSLGCDTGVAVPGNTLSLYRSSLANADVAFLKSYNATDVNGCLNDCCTEKYGSCTVASFSRDAEAVGNCRLFNCRPVQKCKFVSSNSTDSFSFSSSSSGQPRVSVPSSPPTTTTTTATSPHGVDGPLALKNDNTTVKPRKGVLEDIFGSGERSGVKPRKGVSPEGGQSSKVKPRKGVGPQPGGAPSPAPTQSERNESSQTPGVHQEISADDLASALERVFEDDVRDGSSSVTSSQPFPVDPVTSSAAIIRPSSSSDCCDVTPTSLATPTQTSSSSTMDPTPSSALLPSMTTRGPVATSPVVVSSSARTPHLQTTGLPTPSSPTILEHSRLIFHEESVGSSESESERRYRSSIHLVLSLVFGLLILVSVLGVVAKRVYDGWMRRHYRRMDFLIDGMYNGYG